MDLGYRMRNRLPVCEEKDRHGGGGGGGFALHSYTERNSARVVDHPGHAPFVTLLLHARLDSLAERDWRDRRAGAIIWKLYSFLLPCRTDIVRHRA